LFVAKVVYESTWYYESVPRVTSWRPYQITKSGMTGIPISFWCALVLLEHLVWADSVYINHTIFTAPTPQKCLRIRHRYSLVDLKPEHQQLYIKTVLKLANEKQTHSLALRHYEFRMLTHKSPMFLAYHRKCE